MSAVALRTVWGRREHDTRGNSCDDNEREQEDPVFVQTITKYDAHIHKKKHLK